MSENEKSPLEPRWLTLMAENRGDDDNAVSIMRVQNAFIDLLKSQLRVARKISWGLFAMVCALTLIILK